ncbi:hypothetical protein GNF80_04135 [Clostridium perfringens]|nr:hypothetical protein [Clostridium perfringens]
MSLCKGQIKIGKRKVKKRTIRFFFERYLKKNYRYIPSEFNNKHKFEILDSIKIDNLDFLIDIDFYGINPKEIELRSIDNIDKDGIKLYEEWVKRKLGVELESFQWQKRSFRWGTIRAKLTRLHKDDYGCVIVKLKYK